MSKLVKAMLSIGLITANLCPGSESDTPPPPISDISDIGVQVMRSSHELLRMLGALNAEGEFPREYVRTTTLSLETSDHPSVIQRFNPYGYRNSKEIKYMKIGPATIVLMCEHNLPQEDKKLCRFNPDCTQCGDSFSREHAPSHFHLIMSQCFAITPSTCGMSSPCCSTSEFQPEVVYDSPVPRLKKDKDGKIIVRKTEKRFVEELCVKLDAQLTFAEFQQFLKDLVGVMIGANEASGSDVIYGVDTNQVRIQNASIKNVARRLFDSRRPTELWQNDDHTIGRYIQAGFGAFHRISELPVKPLAENKYMISLDVENNMVLVLHDPERRFINEAGAFRATAFFDAGLDWTGDSTYPGFRAYFALTNIHPMNNMIWKCMQKAIPLAIVDFNRDLSQWADLPYGSCVHMPELLEACGKSLTADKIAAKIVALEDEARNQFEKHGYHDGSGMPMAQPMSRGINKRVQTDVRDGHASSDESDREGHADAATSM